MSRNVHVGGCFKSRQKTDCMWFVNASGCVLPQCIWRGENADTSPVNLFCHIMGEVFDEKMRSLCSMKYLSPISMNRPYDVFLCT